MKLLTTASVAISLASLLSPSLANESHVTPEEACVDFLAESDGEISWQFADCVEIWKAWTATLPAPSPDAFGHLGAVRRVAGELRRRGSSCFLQAENSLDGAGSSFIRSITSWILAAEMGCEWVTPVWGRSIEGGNGNGLYCHEKIKRKREDFANSPLLEVADKYKASCTMTDWIQFFLFAEKSAKLPAAESSKVLELKTWETHGFPPEELKELASFDLDNRDWGHLILHVDKSTGAHRLISQKAWNNFQRNAIRRQIEVYRDDFHVFPRPGFEKLPDCAFDNDRLNFAIHIRMGDREALDNASTMEEYFETLDGFMDIVAAVVMENGLDYPMFHVFSESVEPCPDPQTGVFDEFPAWPVELHQVPLCLNAEIPEDCREKRAGLGSCNAIRPGHFKVQERNLMLHVGDDPENSLSCMIHADGGVLMGCSTFGQVAGLLNVKGLRFFSTACDGVRTPAHYKTIPLFAIADVGNAWVPVTGSWRDPVIMSEAILRREMENLLNTRRDEEGG